MSAKELNIGDYVRTNKGEIGKLKDLKLDYTTGKRLVTYYTYKEVKENLVMFDNEKITQRFVDGSDIYLTNDELKNVEESIVKSSPDIIDLIEEGDILEIKDMLDNISKVEVDENFKLLTGKIVTITTREKYEANKYKIGE